MEVISWSFYRNRRKKVINENRHFLNTLVGTSEVWVTAKVRNLCYRSLMVSNDSLSWWSAQGTPSQRFSSVTHRIWGPTGGGQGFFMTNCSLPLDPQHSNPSTMAEILISYSASRRFLFEGTTFCWKHSLSNPERSQNKRSLLMQDS